VKAEELQLVATDVPAAIVEDELLITAIVHRAVEVACIGYGVKVKELRS
jgi:hypothetical protein